MRERGLTGRTVHVTHNVLRSALKQAVRWRLLPQNPATDVDLPRWEKREMRALSPDEVARFRKASKGDPRGVPFDFGLATAMRPAEILGLRWQDVDLQGGTATVRQTLVRTGSAWRFEPPKTEKSQRTIPLPSSMVRALAAHKARQAQIRLRSPAFGIDRRRGPPPRLRPRAAGGGAEAQGAVGAVVEKAKRRFQAASGQP
jgi:integrase